MGHSGRISYMPLPVTIVDKKTAPDIPALIRIFAGVADEDFTVIMEKAPFHAPSSAGLRSMAMGAGLVEGMMITKGFRYHLVLSQVWQREILGTVPKGMTKPYALAAAKRLWPGLPFDPKKDEGPVDACLMAEYGRRKNL